MKFGRIHELFTRIVEGCWLGCQDLKHKTMLVVFSTGSLSPPCAPSSCAFETLPGACIHAGWTLQRSLWMAGRLALEMTGAGLTAAHACTLSLRREEGREVLVFIDGKWWDALVSTRLTEPDDRQAAGVMWPHYSLQCSKRQRINGRETGGEGIEDRERQSDEGESLGDHKESKQLRPWS